MKYWKTNVTTGTWKLWQRGFIWIVTSQDSTDSKDRIAVYFCMILSERKLASKESSLCTDARSPPLPSPQKHRLQESLVTKSFVYRQFYLFISFQFNKNGFFTWSSHVFQYSVSTGIFKVCNMRMYFMPLQRVKWGGGEGWVRIGITIATVCIFNVISWMSVYRTAGHPSG